jgi:hypothetical protein
MWYSVYDGALWASTAAFWLVVPAILYKTLLIALDRLNFRRVALPEIGRIIPWALVSLWTLIVLARVGAGFLAAGQLRTDAAAVASEIITFADAQQRRVPSSDNRRWDTYTRDLARVSAQTQQEYHEKFLARVVFLRQEFAKRQIVDPELDNFYADPKSPLAVRSVGERLAYMAQQPH